MEIDQKNMEKKHLKSFKVKKSHLKSKKVILSQKKSWKVSTPILNYILPKKKEKKANRK